VGGFDKVEHFGASLVVTDLAWASAAALDAPVWGRALVAISTGALVGVGKETYDAACGGDAEVGDLIYDAFGIGAGVGFAFAVEAVVRRTRDPP
jgi:hypothetical protein